MRAVLVPAILVGLSLVTPASAWHCSTWSTSTEGDLGPVVAAADHYALLYCYISQVNGCKYSILVYEETNGIEGLQRGGWEIQDDTCHGMIAPDTIVF